MVEPNAERAESGLESEKDFPMAQLAGAIDILYSLAIEKYQKDHPGAVCGAVQEEWFSIGAILMLGACADCYQYKEEHGQQEKSE